VTRPRGGVPWASPAGWPLCDGDDPPPECTCACEPGHRLRQHREDPDDEQEADGDRSRSAGALAQLRGEGDHAEEAEQGERPPASSRTARRAGSCSA